MSGTRENESIDQSRKRKGKDKEQKKAARQSETVDERNKRLQRQKGRSQANRAKNKIDKRSSSGTYAYFRSISTPLNAPNRVEISENNVGDNADKRAGSTLPFWPEPIPRSLKNNLLQQFVEQMSMSALAESVCAVCNVRAPAKKTKKLPVKEIPGLHLLVVAEDLKDLIITSHSLHSKTFSASSRTDVTSAGTGQASPGSR